MTSTAPSETAPSERRDRTHWLYVAVIVAVAAGIAVGFLWPEFGEKLAPLGTGFVALIKMLIGPIIFCTIVLGIGSVRQAARVGRVGGLALGYFLVMSTVALAIGLIVGNLLHPGSGLEITKEVSDAGAGAVGEEATGTVDFLLGVIPTDPGLGLHRGLGAADPVRRAAGRLRASSRSATAASRSWSRSATSSGWSSRSWR